MRKHFRWAWGVFIVVLVVLSLAILIMAGWYSSLTEEIKVLFRSISSTPNPISDLQARFPQNAVTIEETMQEEAWRYTKQHLKIRSNYEGLASIISAVWWQKKHSLRRKIVIILPIAGSHDPGSVLAQYFLNVEGYDIIQIFGGSNRRFLETDDLRSYSSLGGLKGSIFLVGYFMQLRTVNYMQVVSWLKVVKNYQEVYLFGVSLGAIEGSLLALDPNIKAAALVMGGGDMAEIITYSKEPFVVRWREELIRKVEEISGARPSEEEILRMLRENLSGADPLRYAVGANPKKILMFAGKADETIPLRNTFKLWLGLNQPRLILFPTTHRGMAFYAPVVLYHAGRFFKQDHY